MSFISFQASGWLSRRISDGSGLVQQQHECICGICVLAVEVSVPAVPEPKEHVLHLGAQNMFGFFKNHGFPMNCPFQNRSKLKQLAQGAWTRRAASCWTCCSACSPCSTRTCNASARGSNAWKRPRPRTAASARRRCWEMAAMAAMASMPGMLGLN